MEIKAPDLGVESAEVAEIMVKVGDKVSENDPVLLVESDKASVEVPSPVTGVIEAILVNVGDSISQGTTLFVLTSAGGADTNTATTDSEQPKQTQTTNNTDGNQNTDTNQADTNQDSDKAESVTNDSQTYQLPDLGVESAEVAEIMVKVGDKVSENDPVLLVESDKASVEVPSPVTGVIEAILVNSGDMIGSGQAFITIASQSASKSSSKPFSASNQNSSTAQATNEPKPQSKSSVASDDKASQPLSKPEANHTTSKLNENEVNQKARDVYAGPAVRKLARELGVDIGAIKGSAYNGRVVKDDLFAYVKSIVKGEKTASVAQSGAGRTGLPALPDMSDKNIWGEIEIQELTRLQKVSIPQLNYNTYLPQVTQFDLADITETENLRSSLKAEFKAQGIGLTILAFIVKVVAYALTQNPKFNSHLSDDNTKIIIRKSVNMGIAVATGDGLIVPVIKNTQDKGIKQIAIEIGELAKKARDKKLTAKELQGASFTISSQGNLGGTAFTPLVNFPQVAILGISEASLQPRWNGKAFEPKLMLPLSLSYDHRVINGADAAVFTRYIATLLADPRRVLL